MSVGDAATVFSVEHDTAASLLHMRAQGVSLLVQLKPAGLPVILHWGADLGDLDGLSAPALVAAFGPTGLDPLPSMMSSLVPEVSAAWSSRAARRSRRARSPTDPGAATSNRNFSSSSGTRPGKRCARPTSSAWRAA